MVAIDMLAYFFGGSPKAARGVLPGEAAPVTATLPGEERGREAPGRAPDDGGGEQGNGAGQFEAFPAIGGGAAWRQSDPGDLSVLVVDDDMTHTTLLNALLSRKGMRVDTVHNGSDGLKKYESGSYDMVFMDLEMPIMGGLEAARLIRTRGLPRARSVPIIMLSSYSPARFREQGGLVLVDAYIQKPFEPELLLKIVDARLSVTLDTVAEAFHSAKVMIPPFNINLLRGLFDNKEDCVVLAADYCVELQRLLREVRLSLEHRDERLAGLALENIIGSSALYGAWRVIAAAKRIWASVSRNYYGVALEQMGELNLCCGEVKRFLERELIPAL